jgi:hypothetical protein
MERRRTLAHLELRRRSRNVALALEASQTLTLRARHTQFTMVKPCIIPSLFTTDSCFRASGYGALSTNTLATNATHQGGYVELDVHNMFGMLEEKTTYLALQTIFDGKRPFLISRSTFPSSGKWTGHWVCAVFWRRLHASSYSPSSSVTTTANGNTCT